MNWFNRLLPRTSRSLEDETLFPFSEFQAVGNELMAWSASISPAIHCVQWVTPSTYSKATGAWIFCEQRSGLEMWSNAVRSSIEHKCLHLLRSHGLSKWLADQVRFIYDSHENVVENYAGSYGYRLKG